MIFGLEQEGGSLIAPMKLAHPLHPIDNRSRNKRRNLWVGWCVSSWWPWFPSRSSVLMYIYICIPYMISVIGRRVRVRVIYIYMDVFFRQGPPVAPQATGGPIKKRWPPKKNGGLFKYRRTTLVQRNWRCLCQIWYEIKVKQVFKNFEMSLTANVGEWQYIA